MVATILNEIGVQKALVEAKEILKRLSSEDYAKIPEDVKEYIETNKDDNYEWHYDDSKELNEQELHEYTLPILAYINSEFLLNEEQKAYMEKVYQDNDKKMEEELRKKYNTDDLFQNRNNTQTTEKIATEEPTQEVQMVEHKKESFFSKILRLLGFKRND